LSNEDDSTYLSCTKCGANKLKSEIEESQWNNWICQNCSDKVIGLKLIDFIKTRIQVTEPEDNRSRFIFRELIQNADDKQAEILVLRFEDDALYVANDGKAFTTNSNGDFDKISRILGRHQAEDKEATGHFGSGFQTVYAITNSPEVHSSGHSRRMNPYTNEWDQNFVGLFFERKSPYVTQPDKKGVLFRLPWRDDKAAQEIIRGEKVWEDGTYWPRWQKKERKELFEDLKSYILHAIICCRFLKTIRLIWHEQNSDFQNPYLGFQVIRNFQLKGNETERNTKYCIGTIYQGEITPNEWTGENSWNESFQLEKWKWNEPIQVFRYLIGENTVSENGDQVFLVKKPDHIIAVTPTYYPSDKVLKRGDIFVLFPLFEQNLESSSDKGAFLYSVIPLPTRGKNKFIFSGHFQPSEDRKDVDVDGQNGVFGIWYQHVMISILRLYADLFTILLEQIQSRKIELENNQQIIFNALPGDSLSEWMRPGKENRNEWTLKSKALFNELLASLIEKPILYSNGKWIKPSEAYWANDDLEKKVFEIMGHDVYTKQFTEHPNFKNILSERLEKQKIDNAKFNFIWGQFFEHNKNQRGNLWYGQTLPNKKLLDRETIEVLIRFCLYEQKPIEIQNKMIVPGRDGVLRRIRDYPLLKPNYQFLFEILPDSDSIHDDFIAPQLIEKHKELLVDYRNEDQVIYLLDDLFRTQQPGIQNLTATHHQILSKFLRTLVDSPEWGPKESLKDRRFIPYKQGDNVNVGTLNVEKTISGTHWISGEKIERNYERESIYGMQLNPVPGLTDEVESKIKFLWLVDCGKEEIARIENKLGFIKLMAVKDNPSNFVRHFLSAQHGSLFEDLILKNFTGLTEPDQLNQQKRQFLKALRIYYKSEKEGERYLTREDMSKVPCFYDETGEWHPAGKFVLHIKPELGIFGIKSLHSDFNDWPEKTLLAIGVEESLKCSKIIETIKTFAEEKDNHRKELQAILSWLITSNVAIGKEFRDDVELSERSWVPTTDGAFKNPKVVLIPTSENKLILGEDFEDFLDLTLSNIIIEDKDFAQETSKKQIDSIGIRSKPSLEILLLVLKKKREQNKPPPKNLFEALDKEIRADTEKSKRIMMDDRYGYFYDNKWTDSWNIKIMDPTSIPKELQGMLKIMPARSPHEEYLLADGAKTQLCPNDILKPMASKKILISLELWDQLRELESQIDVDDAENFGKLNIYPINDKLFAPSKIIYEEKSGFIGEGPIGNWYILGPDLASRHKSILGRLGAKNAKALTFSDIFELLKSQKEMKAQLDLSTVSKILRLIKLLSESNFGTFPSQPLWPAECDGEFAWKKPQECYFRDALSIPEEFKHKLNFIALKIDQKVEGQLRNYALKSGTKSFKESLTKLGKIEYSDYIEDENSPRFYNVLAKALNQYFNSAKYADKFAWLNNAKTRISDTIKVSYVIENIKANMNKAALVEFRNSYWVVSIANREPKGFVLEQLSEEIADTCLIQGFPESSLDELRNILYKLLTNEINEWKYSVPDFEPTIEEEIIVNPVVNSTNRKRTITDPEINQPEDIVELTEVFRENNFETNVAGYISTRDQLSSWYNYCQICGRQTPGDETGDKTYETLKRIFTRTGGRYTGENQDYDVNNSLLLCPTHQVLWIRKLVRFSELEKPTPDLKEKILQKIKEENGDQESIPFRCEVFEGERDPKTGKVHREWVRKEITFKPEHYRGFLKTLIDYLEKKDKNRI
jgi:hypothetical protein